MAEKKMERNDSSSTLNGVGGRSTVVSEGWELDIVESNQVFAKLTARVAALEAENKLLNVRVLILLYLL
jgi:cell division protein FtsB